MHVWVEGLLCEKILPKNARQVCFLGGAESAPPPSGISCILIFHYKNLIFGKNNYTMKN